MKVKNKKIFERVIFKGETLPKGLELLERFKDDRYTNIIFNFYQCINDIQFCDKEYCFYGNYKGLLEHFNIYGFSIDETITDISFYDFEYKLLESKNDIEIDTQTILINYYNDIGV